MKKKRLTEKARLESLLRIGQYEAKSTQDLLDYALSEALDLTQSAIGYIYYYDDQRRQFILNTWSKGVMEACTVMDPQTIYDLDKTGIWGEAVRQARPILVNDFAAPHPLKRGYPDGHVPLRRFMTVPVSHQGRIVAVIGLANKEEEYTEKDLQQVALLMSSVWQIAERKKAEVELLRYRDFIENISDGCFEVDLKGNMTFANEAVAKHLGYSIQELIGMNTRQYASPEETKRLFGIFNQIFRTGEPATIQESVLVNREGQNRYIEMSVSLIRDPKGQPTGFRGTTRDITEKKKAEDYLQYISIHDSLTGLYNRFYADSEIDRLAVSRVRPISVIIIDLNDLKKVNDQYGHAMGDQYIKNAATVLKQTFRPEDMIARIGGDEFLVLLPLVDVDVCAQTIERLRGHIHSFNQSHEQPVHLSAGSATAQTGDHLTETIRKADRRMYEEKACMKSGCEPAKAI
ncbi:MAG: diguanylate cyclase [Desulfobacteraceae bacterium]|nr:diguanylate cyclase [Desulfobacteraceae bacterium]